MPIPVEHQLLVSTFGTLLSRCRERANNSVSPWTKQHNATRWNYLFAELHVGVGGRAFARLESRQLYIELAETRSRTGRFWVG